jgi:hypothetical protein
MWIILVVIAALGAGVLAYRGSTGDHGPTPPQQTAETAGQASNRSR